MPTVLILSSHVAASPVGGGAQAAALARLGMETILVPTVIYGRHPGLGAPGGGAVTPGMFDAVIEGVMASGALAKVDAVIAGYFADPRQVASAARLIDAVRAGRPSAWIVVDPIMGDAGPGLYVSEAVAGAIARDLIPRAGLVAPNAWELQRLSGHAITDVPSALAAARSLGKPVLASSIEASGLIGVLYADDKGAWLAAHARQPSAPNGSGDLLTALFVAAVLGGSGPLEALKTSAGEVAAKVAGGAVTLKTTEL